jgi:hypothetical protein
MFDLSISESPSLLPGSTAQFWRDNPWLQPDIAASTGYSAVSIADTFGSVGGQPNSRVNNTKGNEGPLSSASTNDPMNNYSASLANTGDVTPLKRYLPKFNAYYSAIETAKSDAQKLAIGQVIFHAYLFDKNHGVAPQYKELIVRLWNRGKYDIDLFKRVSNIPYYDRIFFYASIRSSEIRKFSTIHDYLHGKVRSRIYHEAFKANDPLFQQIYKDVEYFLKRPSHELAAWQKQKRGYYEHAADMYYAMSANKGAAADLIAETGHRLRVHLTYGDAFDTVEKRFDSILNNRNKTAALQQFKQWTSEVKRKLQAANDPQLNKWVNDHYDTTAAEAQKWMEAGVLRSGVFLLRFGGWLQGLMDISKSARDAGRASTGVIAFVGKNAAAMTEVAGVVSAPIAIIVSCMVVTSITTDAASGNINNSKGIGRLFGDLFYSAGLIRLNQDTLNKLFQTKTFGKAEKSVRAFFAYTEQEMQPILAARATPQNIRAVGAVANSATEIAIGDGLNAAEAAENLAALEAPGAVTAGIVETRLINIAPTSAVTMGAFFAAGDIAVGVGSLVYGVEQYRGNHVMRGIANMTSGVSSILAGAVGLAVVFSGGMAAAPILGGVFVAMTFASLGLGIWAAKT